MLKKRKCICQILHWEFKKKSEKSSHSQKNNKVLSLSFVLSLFCRQVKWRTDAYLWLNWQTWWKITVIRAVQWVIEGRDWFRLGLHSWPNSHRPPASLAVIGKWKAVHIFIKKLPIIRWRWRPIVYSSIGNPHHFPKKKGRAIIEKQNTCSLIESKILLLEIKLK